MRVESEEDLRALGYEQDADGNWRKADLPRNSPLQMSKPKRAVRSRSLAKKKEEAGTSKRFRVVVTAFCHRDRDPDNLCPKVWIDKLVFHRIIPDDSSKYIESFEKKVVKIPADVREHTEIEVFEV